MLRSGTIKTTFTLVLLLFGEIAVKVNIGKLQLNTSIEDLSVFCFQNHIEIIPVSLQHISAYVHLPLLHKDPFDRMLFAQALVQDFTIITKDSYFEPYKASVLW